jgi:methionyl-tRNA formyltransferase
VSTLRIVFAGTPGFAATHLNALLDTRHDLVAVYTQPDRPAGRGRKLQVSPVKHMAQRAGLPVYQPLSMKDAATQRQLDELGADLLVVVAYGLILPQVILDTPLQGCLNVHASLLPRWRGAAPIQRAIESGDKKSGITIMQMDAGLDTGDVLAIRSTSISAGCTSADLHDQLATLGAGLLLEVLADLSTYQSNARKQSDLGITYAHKILKTEAEIDWSREARDLGRTIRAFNPSPVCYTFAGMHRLKIWYATAISETVSHQPPGTVIQTGREGIVVSCGTGQLQIHQLQLAGGKLVTAEQFLNAKGALFTPGTRLGGSAQP